MIEEEVRRFRAAFNNLPTNVQMKEVQRLYRIAKGRPALIAEPIAEPDRKFKFQSVEHMVTWLRSGEHPRANSSNIYKVLKKKRDSAYGYAISFENEGGNIYE